MPITNRKQARNGKWFRILTDVVSVLTVPVTKLHVYLARGGKGKPPKCPIAKAMGDQIRDRLAAWETIPRWQGVKLLFCEVEKSRAYAYFSNGTAIRLGVPFLARLALNTFDETGIFKPATFTLPSVEISPSRKRAREQVRAFRTLIEGATIKHRAVSRRDRRGLS